MNYTHIPTLLELQEVDLKIYQLEMLKNQKPKILEEKNNLLKQKQAELEKYQEEAKKTRVESDRKNLDLKEKEEKIQKLNIQLNTIKTNKEYTAITNEINTIKADVSMFEDAILGLLSHLDELHLKAEQNKKEMADFQKEVQKMEESVKSEIVVIDAELEALGKKRKEIIQKLPAELVNTYEKVLAHKEDHVVLAKIQEGVCQGCFMDVTPQEINDLMKGKEVIRCRVCSRILYL